MNVSEIIIKIRSYKLKELAYPLISIIYVVSIGFLFIAMARYLTSKINMAFFLDQASAESQIIKIDAENYNKIAGKLGLPKLSDIDPNADIDAQLPEAPVASDSSQNITESPNVTPDVTPETAKKMDIKISVLNATSISGQAGIIKTALTSLGYSQITTGNSPVRQNTTTFKYKAGTVLSVDEIKKAISAKFSISQEMSLAENEPFDIVILLGLPK